MVIQTRSIRRAFLILITVLISLVFISGAWSQDYKYRRSITVDRTKVTNPATFPIAFDAVSSAKTADAGASNLSWSHTVGSGNDKIAIVSVSSKRDSTGAVTFDSSATANTGSGTNNILSTSHSVGSGSNRLALVSVATNPGSQVTLDNVTSANTGTNTATSLSFNHSVLAGTNRIAIVSVATRPAVVFDAASSNNTGTGTATTLSWTHTVGSENNRILIVGVAINRAGGSQTVSSVTFGGNALTFLGQAPNTTNCTAELWYLLAPTSGPGTVQVTISAAARFVAGATSYSDVMQVAPSNFAQLTGSVSPAAVTVTTGRDDLVVDVFGHVDSTPVWAPTAAAQVQRWTNATTNGTPANNMKGYGSTRRSAGTTTQSSWTISTGSTTQWSLAAARLRPVAATIGSVTFNGTNITANLIGSTVNSNNCAVYMYYMLNPNVANNQPVVVTLTSGSTGTRFVASAADYYNVSQTAPLGTFVSSTGNTTTPSVTATSAANELVIDTLAHVNSTDTASQDPSQALIWSNATTNGTAAANVRGYGSSEPGAASTIMSWTIGATARQWAIGAMPLKPATATVTNVTYAGTNITSNLVGTATNSGNCAVSLYYMLNPPNAANNVSVTLSGSTWFVIAAASFSGVHQTTPFGTFQGSSGYSTTASVNVSSSSTELVVDALALQDDALSGTPTSPQVKRWEDWTQGVGANGINNYGSSRTGAASTTMSWSLDGTSNWAIGAVPLRPASPPVTITQVMFGATNITANLVGSVTNSGNCEVSMYYLKNPATGTSTVSVTQSASTMFIAGAFSLFNVDQTTPLGTFASNVGSGQGTWAASVDVPSASGEIVVAALAKRFNYSVRPEQSTQQADRWQLSTGLGTSEDILSVGTLRGGEASARAYWALTGGSTWQEWAIGGVPVKPTTVAPAQMTTLTNYPLLVSLSHTTLRDEANSGHVENANGYDIIFMASDGVTQLDHEIEKYDGVNGQVVAWVRLPSVNGAGAGSDTIIYMYYGNPGISSPTENKAAVWDASYMDVFHLAESSPNNAVDSKNGYVGTITNEPDVTREDAKIDGAYLFGGSSYVVTNDGQFNVANAPFTIEAWFYIESGTPTWVGIATKNRDVSCDDNPPYCDWTGVWIGGSGELTYAWDWHNQGNMGGGPALSTGTWYYGAIVFDGGMRTGYRDGLRDSIVAAPNPSPGVYTRLTMPTRMNSDMPGGGNMIGTIDEVRVSTIARSPGWILTSYNNMDDPGNIGSPGFYTVGDEGGPFQYRRPITFLNSMTPGSCSADLSNFPVLVSIKDSTLRTVGNGGHVQNSSGYDIIFRALDGVTHLDHEIEKYDGSSAPVTNTFQISANNRDAWDDGSSGSLNDADFSDAYFGDVGGYQFAVTIPQGATITSARLRLYFTGRYGTPAAYTAKIGIEDVDNASVFTGAGNNIWGRIYWGTTVDWSMPLAGLAVGWHSSPDITNLIQHIVNRAGWSSGNYLSVAIGSQDNTGGTKELINDYSDGSSLAAQLEVTYLDPSAGQLVAWVRIPTLTYNGDTTIYMYYGNSAITSPTANPTGVWDTNFKGIWHLKENPAGTAPQVRDSTSNNLHGTSNGSMTSGDQVSAKINGGLDFDGGDDYLDHGDVLNSITVPFTIEAWVNHRGAPATCENETIFASDDSSTTYSGLWFHIEGCTNELAVCYGDGGGGGADHRRSKHSTPTISENTWTHVAGVVRGATDMSLYINGTEVAGTYSGTGGAMASTSDPARMGVKSGSPLNLLFNGILDEVRISDRDRGACWIGTEFNNQSLPLGTYYALGSEEGPAPPVPTAVTLKSIEAVAYREGVLLNWKTSYEVNNFGFHIYREENGQIARLTPEPVAGSAFLAGRGTSLTAGRQYHWWDTSLGPQSSSLGTVKYWLKDIDLKGKHTMHGPVTPVFSKEPLPNKFRPELLSEVGLRLQEKYRDFWKVRDLKEKLGNRRSATGHRPPAVRRASNLKAEGRSSNVKPLRLSPQSSSLDTAMQRYLANRPAVKLFVREEGWYRVNQSELVAAGLNPKANPHYLQLYTGGKEQPIRLIEGKNRKSVSLDAVEFYGVGVDTPSTDTRVYWLAEGSRPGKRIEELKSYSGSLGSLSPSSFPYTVEKKDRTIYFAALRNGEKENFFGPVVYMNQVDQMFELQHLDLSSSEDALLEVVLQGSTETPHRVRVLLNEVEVGEIAFEGQRKGTLNIAIPQTMLEEGENLVSLVASGDEMDASLVDLIRLTYWHTYTADNNGLRFTAQGGNHLAVNGFSHPNIRVIDITDSNEVIEVIGRVESQKGGYAISFRVPEHGERTLLAMTDERVKSAIEIASNHPSRWHQERGGYDFIIISHRDFMNNLQPLKHLRESQGLKVALIDIEDLYDEFSFGEKSPKVLKDFLGLAKKKWHKPPRFVLLVGDASFDPRNYLGLGDMDYVPTKLIDTVHMETASDDWFVDFNSDGLPEMAVGRLPVQTKEEAAIVVSKIVGYEKSSKRNEVLLVSDVNDGFNFEGASEEVRALLPGYLTVRKIFREQFSSDAQAKTELLRGINQGPLLVNFIGHGSVESWRGSLLTLEDADGLINGLRLPFFINMTCLNGYFQNPYGETLAEALMKASGGGAIAIWTSSGLTEPDKQAVMNKELIKLLFFNTNGGQSLTLGEATARAKAATGDQDVKKTWILFGDPSTRLK